MCLFDLAESTLRKFLHRSSLAISISTLAIYVFTLLTVSYVGVYLTYIAVPVIITFGSIAYISASKQGGPRAPSTPEERILEIDARLKELGD